ncbi:MAG: hypothetical protein ACTSW7_01300 [Candidatus Thorarchaeota archaeon]|nr:hypothetical protein [Thermoplasmatales archaeon]
MVTKDSTRRAIERIKGTVVPKAFSSFVGLMEEISETEHRLTVTTFSDENGLFVSLMKQGSNNEKINLVFNKSRGWNPQKQYKRLMFEPWHTGDLRVMVLDGEKAIKQAFKLCKEWKEAKPFHKPTVTVKGEKKEDARRFPRPV